MKRVLILVITLIIAVQGVYAQTSSNREDLYSEEGLTFARENGYNIMGFRNDQNSVIDLFIVSKDSKSSTDDFVGEVLIDGTRPNLILEPGWWATHHKLEPGESITYLFEGKNIYWLAIVGNTVIGPGNQFTGRSFSFPSQKFNSIPNNHMWKFNSYNLRGETGEVLFVNITTMYFPFFHVQELNNQ